MAQSVIIFIMVYDSGNTVYTKRNLSEIFVESRSSCNNSYL